MTAFETIISGVGSHLPERVVTNDDLAKIVEGMGVWSEGPYTDPKDLGPAIARALDVVDSGEPAFVHVRTQPR